MSPLDNIVTAQEVASIWFMVIFGLALLAPAYGWTLRKVWNLGRK